MRYIYEWGGGINRSQGTFFTTRTACGQLVVKEEISIAQNTARGIRLRTRVVTDEKCVASRNAYRAYFSYPQVCAIDYTLRSALFCSLQVSVIGYT